MPMIVPDTARALIDAWPETSFRVVWGSRLKVCSKGFRVPEVRV